MGSYFLGLILVNDGGGYKWDNGSPLVTYDEDGFTEDPEECAVILLCGGYCAGEWQDVTCGSSYYYLCEIGGK
jgi:hypothetical protein